MRTFAIIFNGGFGLSENLNQVAEAVLYGNDVEIRDFVSREDAYIWACREHCQRSWEIAPKYQIYLPRLEDMTKNPIFRSIGYLPYYPAVQKFFAAVNINYVAILDNPNAVIAFMEKIQNVTIKEQANIYEAQNYIDFQFLKYILPFGAYIEKSIPRCPTIPLNSIVPIKFKEWFRENKPINFPAFNKSILDKPELLLETPSQKSESPVTINVNQSDAVFV